MCGSMASLIRARKDVKLRRESSAANLFQEPQDGFPEPTTPTTRRRPFLPENMTGLVIAASSSPPILDQRADNTPRAAASSVVGGTGLGSKD